MAEFTKKLLFFPFFFFFFFFSFFLQSTTEGVRLLEFFSVRINNIDNENPGELYGTITIRSVGRGSYYLYNRRKEDREDVRPNELILLQDPTLANNLIVNDGFNIKMDLKDWDPVGNDDQVSSGSADDLINVLDTPKSAEAKGAHGSATVNYMVISDGVVAYVTVTLVNGNNRITPIVVHGELAARNANFPNESLLFRKRRSENILVSPRTRIPLSRTKISVLKSSSLVIRANLSGYDVLTSSSFEIANGNAVFPTAVDGTRSVLSIKGQDGEIRVEIYWETYTD